MRRTLFLAFLVANLLVVLAVAFQMATTPQPPTRPKGPETGGYYELFSGNYVPSEEELNLPDRADAKFYLLFKLKRVQTLLLENGRIDHVCGHFNEMLN